MSTVSVWPLIIGILVWCCLCWTFIAYGIWVERREIKRRNEWLRRL